MENLIYIVNADVGLRVRSAPLIPAANEPDNKVDKLENGKEVVLISKNGVWFEVEYKANDDITKKGWVSSDYLVPKNIVTEDVVVKQDLLFQEGVPNLWDNANTKIIREAIGDEFGGGRNKWDLQCTEYVQYKIKQLGLDIKWPVKNNRNGGNWAIIFEMRGPYKVLDIPKQYCAISFPPTSNNPFGHIAFVEKVDPTTLSISISEANVPGRGMYKERTMAQTVWKEKKARFIDFSDETSVINIGAATQILGGISNVAPKTIFLSYSNKDIDLAKEIKSFLAKDFDVFLAREDIRLSDDWSERIKAEIQSRHLFISLRTVNFFGSTIAEQESGIAMGLDKNIIPLFNGVDPKDSGLLYTTNGFIFEMQKTTEENCKELSKQLLLIE